MLPLISASNGNIIFFVIWFVQRLRGSTATAEIVNGGFLSGLMLRDQERKDSGQ